MDNMKKLLYILLFLPLGLFGQTQIINVGTTANDGTGDPLRTAMQKINLNTVAIQDTHTVYRALFGNIFTKAGTRNEINDTIEARIAAASELGDIAPLWTDTTLIIATKTDLLNIEGGGTASKFYILSGNVDATGFPAAGDTSLTHTNFIGKHLNVFREGQLQQQHTNNTTQDGFWLNNATGEIRLRPALSAGEQLEIWSTNTIQWEALTAEGGGAESTLLTSLRAFWQLDEVSGTAVNDVLGVYNGTTTGAVNQAGKFGVAETFTRSSAQWANIGTTVGDVGTSDFSIAAWVYVTSFPSATMGVLGNVYDLPWYYLGFNSTNHAYAIINFGGGNITLEGNSVLSATTWYHLALVCDRSGNATLYVNGVAQTDVEDISSGVAVALNNSNSFGIGSLGNLSGYTFNGTVDAAGIWLKILSGAELTTLQTKTYPWN